MVGLAPNDIKRLRSPLTIWLGEILSLRWEWVDFERGEARLPDSKTGAKTIHLPPPALAVLAELPRVESNPHVIVGAVPGAALVNLEKPWRASRAGASKAGNRNRSPPRHGFGESRKGGPHLAGFVEFAEAMFRAGATECQRAIELAPNMPNGHIGRGQLVAG